MVFNDHNLSFNSHLALLAGEVAQDMGKFEKFHENIFRAFFTDHKNIGQLEVILDIVAASGLDQEIFTESLNRNRYETRLEDAVTEAARLGIRSIPAFVFEGDQIVFGALSPDIFHETLKRIQKRSTTNPFM